MAENILLVDDETEFLEAMSIRMTARDMNVSTASSAQEAIEKIKGNDFDAIVLDYQLPGMDGLNALREIKAIRPESRIILLTGFATVEKRDEALKMGAVELLEKPVDLRVLSRIISRDPDRESDIT